VWGINLLALYSAYFFDPGWGLVAPYLMLVNAIGHIGTTFRVKAYNPGLVTSLLLFLPLSVTALIVVRGSLVQHLIALGLSLALHAVIAITAARRAGARPSHLAAV
jgi:hypothetical protein